MPRKKVSKVTKKVYRRRVRRRRKYPYNQSVQRGIVSKRQLVKLRYVDNLTLTGSVAGVPATHVFSANGLYDPDYTGTGHQPMGFDEWGNFYNHYTVIGALCKATFISAGTTPNIQSAFAGVNIMPGVGVLTDYRDVLEQPRRRYKLMTNSGASGSCIVTNKVGIGKFLGQKVMSEDSNAGTWSSNPSEQVYFHIYISPINQALTVGTAYVQLEINYIAILHEPKALNTS